MIYIYIQAKAGRQPKAHLYQRHTNCSVSDLFATGICPKANRPNRT